jgi:hypothetical protein
MTIVPRGITIADRWLDQIRATGTEPDPDTTQRIYDECHWNRPCQDCGAQLGTAHEYGCDVARCPRTGTQQLACDRLHECGADIWDGVWPGTSAAVEYGWYSHLDHGWQPCGPEHPQAVPDLNRVPLECDWNPQRKAWVKR